MRRVAWVLLVLMAGCFGGSANTAGPPDGATATTGVLQGVVVDDAIRPLGAALVNVTAEGVALNATTGEDGRFRFTGLDPGTYIVEASKADYSVLQQAIVVVAGVDDPEVARFQLAFEPGALPFAQTYKHEGYHECGAYFQGAGAARVCSNVNIATWIVVCGRTGGAVCVGNVTNDRSVFFQTIESPPTFIQAELFWDSTSAAGTELSMLIGGGTEEELKTGANLPAFNFSAGPSPLMVRVSNHEGPSAWCRNVPDPPCSERALADSAIGTERVLLGQIDSGAAVKTPACDSGVSPCGAGWSMLQGFTLFTTVFYGYEPPLDWLYTEAGKAPDPPGRP